MNIDEESREYFNEFFGIFKEFIGKCDLNDFYNLRLLSFGLNEYIYANELEDNLDINIFRLDIEKEALIAKKMKKVIPVNGICNNDTIYKYMLRSNTIFNKEVKEDSNNIAPANVKKVKILATIR